MVGSGGRPTFVWDEKFLRYDFGPGHPFRMIHRQMAVQLLEGLGVFDEPAAFESPASFSAASEESLRRFHEPTYLSFVRAASEARARSPLDAGDTPGFPGCYDASARIAGATILAARSARSRPCARAVQLSGGLHHAQPARASGFCIFNDVAVAIADLLEGPAPARRVAYVDIDAHHGDGVMYGFYRDGRLLNIDFHQDGRTLFPGTGSVSESGDGDGAGLKVNVPLPPGAGDEALVPLFHRIVPPLLEEFRPELIILQCGVDGHAQDALAQLQYTWDSYEAAIETLLQASATESGPSLVVTGGGGYTPESVARILARVSLHLADRPQPSDASATSLTFRKTFERESSRPPPTNWSELGPTESSPWNREKHEKLVGALERTLGRRFPA